MTWVPRWLYEASCTLYCRGGLLRTLQTLDEEEDINKILDFFSYEHFYVIYCKVGSTRYQQCIDVRMSASAVAMDSSGAAVLGAGYGSRLLHHKGRFAALWQSFIDI